MNKYGQATEKQIETLIAFMESNMLRREFTLDEKANMNEVPSHNHSYSTIRVHRSVLDEFNKELNEDTANMVRKLAMTFKKF